MTNLVNPASATTIGLVFLGERLGTTPVEVIVAAGCALLSGFGVAQLARARDVSTVVAPPTPAPREDLRMCA